MEDQMNKVEEVVEETPAVQQEGDIAPTIESTVQAGDNLGTPLSDLERELLLLELGAITNMMGVQFMNPQTVGQGEEKPRRLVGGGYDAQYKLTNVYGLEEIYMLRQRADEICGLLGINLRRIA